MMRDLMNSAVFDLKRSAIREFAKLAKQTPGCISLTLGEPDFDTPDVVRDQAKLSLDNGETHYIENNGLKELREKIADYETTKHGFDCNETQVIVTAGATEALFVSLFGILNPGDEVIIPTPAFVLYEEIVKLCRAKPVRLDTSIIGFHIRKSTLEGCITDKTKAIVLNTPNNPTGTILDRESLEAIREVCLEHDLFVICDDVYRELVYTDDYHSFTEFTDVRDKTILVQSFSKPWAMTGWRMGYLIAPYDIKERMELVHQFMVVSTPAPFQKAAIKALEYDPIELKETYRKRRDYVLKRLGQMGLEVPEPLGAFYVFPSVERFGIGSEVFCRRMIEEAGLAATPGLYFGCEGHIRLTYCYNDEQLKEGLNRLEDFIRRLEGK